MRLKSIINSARNRELKNLSPKDKTDEVIIGYINLALIDLYSLFQLRTEELILNLKTGKTVYRLDGTDTDVYRDGMMYVDDDVMSVIRAFDEEKEISINKDSDPLSVYTISYNKVQVPFATTGEHIGLIYRAAPVEIVYEDDMIDGTTVDMNVDLPKHMLEALLCHIGYSAYSSLESGQEADINRYIQRYDRACKRIQDLGLVPQDTLDLDMDRKGFL